MITSVCETKKYKLGTITDISVDSDKGTEWLRALPPFLITDNGKNTVFVEEDKNILEIWSQQRSEVKSFVYAVVQSLEWLVQAVSDMKIRKVGGVCTAAFHKGAKEPGLLATNVPGLKTRHPIKEQDKFIYCHHTMEGEDFAKKNAAVHEYL